MEKAINHPDKSKMLVSIFNDENPDYINELKSNIELLEGFKTLHYKPVYKNIPMDKDSKIIDELKLAETELIPTLFFIDPFGYKGLSLTLIHSVLKDWGSDGIFFFNYQRINSAISNEYMISHMETLFGSSRLKKLNMEVQDLAPRQRERLILDYLVDAIKEIGGNYVLDFRFPHYGEERTSHYLIFVSKHIKGYRVMKEILAKNSNSHNQGVASFEFNSETTTEPELPFPYTYGPLDKLKVMLLTHFKGRELLVSQIYEEHDIGETSTRHYTLSNYKDALLHLEKEGKIKVDKSASERQVRNGKLTLGNGRIVKFLNKRK